MPEYAEAQKQLAQWAKTYESEIKELATALQAKLKQYDQEAESQTDEENAKRFKEVQDLQKDIREYQINAQKDMQEKELDLLKPITDKAKEAILKVARAQGFDYVLNSTQGNGLIMADGKDLMADVQKELGFLITFITNNNKGCPIADSLCYFCNMLSNNNSIGIFDSGVGGISIWKEINALRPNESTIYLADSKNAPYGPKGNDKIIELAIKNTECLLEQNCKLIVVACNTATTNAIDYLRNNYKVPFIGIEPAIKPAALQSKHKAIGILATKGTLSSALFNKTSSIYAQGIDVIEVEGIGIVELIESGNLYSDAMTALLKSYLEPMVKENIDYLVLGCTHYPFLIPQLIKLLPQHVKIIDSGEAVARQTKHILELNNLSALKTNRPLYQFYSNVKTNVFEQLLNTRHKVTYFDF
jgi:glutamate racemase